MARAPVPLREGPRDLPQRRVEVGDPHDDRRELFRRWVLHDDLRDRRAPCWQALHPGESKARKRASCYRELNAERTASSAVERSTSCEGASAAAAASAAGVGVNFERHAIAW